MELELVENYPKRHDVEQRSEEWFSLRMGKITASNFPMLMGKDRVKGKLSDTKLNYILEKACEVLTGEREEGFTNDAMQWGIDHETEAIEHYEGLTFRGVEEVGFYEISEYLGDSPDGITTDRAIEIKCPKSTTHLSYFMDKSKLLNKYKWQCYAHMWATGLNKCDLISYDPRFPDDKKMVIVEITKDDEEMKQLTDRMDYLVGILKGFING